MYNLKEDEVVAEFKIQLGRVRRLRARAGDNRTLRTTCDIVIGRAERAEESDDLLEVLRSARELKEIAGDG